MSPLQRRDFLRLMALQMAAWSLGCGRHEGGTRGSAGASRGSAGAGLPPNPFGDRWLGDDFTMGHKLRDGELPPLDGAPLESATDVLVVGGGISGLTTAWQLAKAGHRVTILEQASEIGGNAKSATWGDIRYSIGAAYFTRPDAGSELETLYREIGVLDRAVKVPKGEAFFDGRLVEHFWEGSTDTGAEAIAATKRIAAEWRKIYDGRYPDIPWKAKPDGFTRAQFHRLDRLPFGRYLEQQGAPPHVRQFCEYYCWSSFGGSASEISTYAALNFLTAEFADILALPGGNSGVAMALADALRAKGVRIETGAFVASVASSEHGVEAGAYRGGSPARFPARACVVAVPRFIARRIVAGFPEARATLVDSMKWRAYVVANVLLARRPSVEWYDSYRIEELDAHASGWTDLIVADFVASPKSEHCVLTAYRALPYDGGRAELLTDDSRATFRDAVRRDLQPWLAAIGLADRDIAGINMARWGHPLVLAQPGQLAGGALAKISAPFGRVAFAHQDRYGVPAIENAIGAAFEASREVARLL
jgi:hypothetical protein